MLELHSSVTGWDILTRFMIIECDWQQLGSVGRSLTPLEVTALVQARFKGREVRRKVQAGRPGGLHQDRVVGADRGTGRTASGFRLDWWLGDDGVERRRESLDPSLNLQEAQMEVWGEQTEAWMSHWLRDGS